MDTSTTRDRSDLIVRQVQNDENPSAPKSTDVGTDQAWIWLYADHAVFALFVLVSIIALFSTMDSFSNIRQMLMPDYSVLCQRMEESYMHISEAASRGFNFLMSGMNDNQINRDTNGKETL